MSSNTILGLNCCTGEFNIKNSSCFKDPYQHRIHIFRKFWEKIKKENENVENKYNILEKPCLHTVKYKTGPLLKKNCGKDILNIFYQLNLHILLKHKERCNFLPFKKFVVIFMFPFFKLLVIKYFLLWYIFWGAGGITSYHFIQISNLNKILTFVFT